MTYKVVLIHSDEGYSVSCPSLPGCASQGETETEALANIKDAIHDYLEVMEELKIKGAQPEGPVEVEFREVQVA